MAEITDPIVTDFVNVHLRRLAEETRNLKARLDDASNEYTTVVQPVLAPFANDDVLNDGRSGEGVYQPTKQEIAQLITHLAAIITTLETAGAEALRTKFSVRPLFQ